MQRRHFEAIARAIKSARETIGHEAADRVTLEMIAEVRSLNPQFNVERFKAACGWRSGQ